MPSGPHDEFLEFCVVSTSDQLSEEEQARLKEHLAVCPACREALREYESVVNDAIPGIGAEQSSRIDPGLGWSQSKGIQRTVWTLFVVVTPPSFDLSPCIAETGETVGIQTFVAQIFQVSPQMEFTFAP